MSADPKAKADRAKLPLAGVRVLDLSRLLPGPFASMVLADLGAQVDKLEDRRGGDYLRFMPMAHQGINASFRTLNRGKRSLVLDLKKEAGKEAFRKLIKRYDVLIESFRPGVMERLGLGYESLKAEHPGLIYCAITGYGQDGPLAQRAGHDLNYLARAGVLSLFGPQGGPPQVPGVQIADIGGGALYGVVGILSALLARQAGGEGGEGRFVDISMCEGAMTFGAFGLPSAHAGSGWEGGEGALSGGIAAFSTYRTKDGGHMSLAALEPKFWVAFCTGVGIEADMEALVPGPRQGEFKAKLSEIFLSKSRSEWEAFAEKVDCCLEPVLSPAELIEDPQHRARGALALDESGLPQIRTPLTPRGEAPPEPPPQQGEHSAQILEEAGFTEAEIEALRATRATD